MITKFIGSILKDYQQKTFGFENLEEEIQKRLKRIGYDDKSNEKDKGEIGLFLKECKEYILDSDKIIANPFKNKKPFFIYQPYNSQSFPDFLIFENELVIAFEVKSLTKGGTRPMWNGGLPRPNSLYFFVSKKDNEIKGLTFFKGELLSTAEETKDLELMFKKIKNYEKKLNQQHFKKFPNGSMYSCTRKAFIQKISSFNENQNKREKDTLAWLTTVES